MKLIAASSSSRVSTISSSISIVTVTSSTTVSSTSTAAVSSTSTSSVASATVRVSTSVVSTIVSTTSVVIISSPSAVRVITIAAATVPSSSISAAAATVISTTSTVSASSATASITAATTTASSATLATRLCLINTESTAIDFLPVQRIARLLGIGRWHRDEAEPTDLTRVTVGGHETVGDRTELFKQTADFRFGCIERKVSNVKLDLLLASRVETTRSTRSKSRPTFTLRTRLVDTDRPSVEFGLVHLGNGLFGAFTVGHRDEAEPTEPSRVAVHRQEDIRYGTELCEFRTEFVIIRCVIKIPDVKLDFITGSTVRICCVVVSRRRSRSITATISRSRCRGICCRIICGWCTTFGTTGTITIGHD
mmetsp:Transcript_37421/g.90947  ORF Transcript_37421/g.90947 Transcript_37421/m.90947 type:complete len:366 (-) Transcript_37421:158-1255(-)